jgi:hypothetical protein
LVQRLPREALQILVEEVNKQKKKKKKSKVAPSPPAEQLVIGA